MKIIDNDDKIIVFLNNKQYIKDEEKIEDYFKSLFIKLEDKYNLDIDYNDVCVYVDYNYGMILEFRNSDLEYFFDNIDVKINIFKNHYFLYKIDYNYINKDILNHCIVYKNKDSIYLKIKKEIDEKIFLKILEYSDIIYGERAIKIENSSKKVNYEKASSSISWKT